MEKTKISIESHVKGVLVINLEEKRHIYIEYEAPYNILGGEWLKPNTVTEFCFCNDKARKAIEESNLKLSITERVLGNLSHDMQYHPLNQQEGKHSYLLHSNKIGRIPSLLRLASAIVALEKPSREMISGIPITLQQNIPLDWKKPKNKIIDWTNYYETKPIVHRLFCECKD